MSKPVVININIEHLVKEVKINEMPSTVIEVVEILKKTCQEILESNLNKDEQPSSDHQNLDENFQ